jgi:hypothetical protein
MKIDKERKISSIKVIRRQAQKPLLSALRVYYLAIWDLPGPTYRGLYAETLF